MVIPQHTNDDVDLYLRFLKSARIGLVVIGLGLIGWVLYISLSPEQGSRDVVAGDSSSADMDDYQDTNTYDPPTGGVDEPPSNVWPELRGRGIDEGMVQSLSVVGTDLTYLWEQASFDDAQTLALTLVMVCDRVESRETSWQREATEAVASGASPGDAGAMNAYARDSFCPYVN